MIFCGINNLVWATTNFLMEGADFGCDDTIIIILSHFRFWTFFTVLPSTLCFVYTAYKGLKLGQQAQIVDHSHVTLTPIAPLCTILAN